MKKYAPREWFSVIYKATGKKKCDCGWEIDAMNMVARNPDELTYVRSNNHLMGQVIDVTPPPALPTNEVVKSKEPYIPVRSIADDIVVNMDGGVGGSWYESESEGLDVLSDIDDQYAHHFGEQKKLPESDWEPVDLS